MFGQTVEYVAADSSFRMYDMLKSNEADLALTLWPAKYWSTNRSVALSKSSCPRSSTGRCVSIAGVHGYRARSGWFVTASPTTVVRHLHQEQPLDPGARI